jgi:hypothetical protein
MATHEEYLEHRVETLEKALHLAHATLRSKALALLEVADAVGEVAAVHATRIVPSSLPLYTGHVHAAVGEIFEVMRKHGIAKIVGGELDVATKSMTGAHVITVTETTLPQREGKNEALDADVHNAWFAGLKHGDLLEFYSLTGTWAPGYASGYRASNLLGISRTCNSNSMFLVGKSQVRVPKK